LCFFQRLKKNPDSGLSQFSLGVHTWQVKITGATAELAEFRKITTFEGKNTISNDHPVYKDIYIYMYM